MKKSSKIVTAVLVSAAALFSEPAFSQNGFVKDVLVAPFPENQPDLTYTLNNRGGKRNPFNPNPDQYRMMGVYKVKGNSYLLRGSNATDVFMKQGYAKNVNVVYDLYDQKFSVLVENNTQLLKLETTDIDSFRVNKDTAEAIKSFPATFVNAGIGKNKKSFLERLINTSHYGLYKSYKSEMHPSSNDIAQTNLQEFVTENDYYYLDKTNPKDYKKIKLSVSSLKDEFRNNPIAVEYLKNRSSIEEAELIQMFEKMN